MSEKDEFDRIIADLKAGKKNYDDLSPEECEVVSTHARKDESSRNVPEQSSDGLLPELSSDKAFADFLEKNLAAFCVGLDAKTKLMVIILGRELKSHRPTARLQSARLLGEVLGVMKRRKDGGISPDSGTSGEGSVSDLEAMLQRGGNV